MTSSPGSCARDRTCSEWRLENSAASHCDECRLLRGASIGYEEEEEEEDGKTGRDAVRERKEEEVRWGVREKNKDEQIGDRKRKRKRTKRTRKREGEKSKEEEKRKRKRKKKSKSKWKRRRKKEEEKQEHGREQEVLIFYFFL